MTKLLKDPEEILTLLDQLPSGGEESDDEEDFLEEDIFEESDDDSEDPDYQPDVENVEEDVARQIEEIEAAQKEDRKRKKTDSGGTGGKKKKLRGNPDQSSTVQSQPKPHIVKISEKDSVSGKNGFVWKTDCISSAYKTPKKNIVHIRPGPTPLARACDKPIDCFKLFISYDIIDKIVIETNKEINVRRAKYNVKDATVDEMSRNELLALIGLLILSAAKKDNHLTSEMLFDDSYSGSRYKATMSERRFKFLLNCLRFDDKLTREARRLETKLAPISEIWELLIENCRSHYKPGSYLTIDEQLVGFRGRCPFWIYIPSKPNKYGIKIVIMCDSSSSYVIDALPYTRKGTVPANQPVPDYIVKRLVKTVKGSNRNLTMDNWFNSIPLALSLLKDDKLTLVGTIKKNKRELPKEFTDVKFSGRGVQSSVFLFTDQLTAVSYKPKENKLVTLLSTMHDDDSIHAVSGKPDIVHVYNSTKGGVDTFDQMSNNMNCCRKSRRWPFVFLCNMLNISAVNGHIIYTHNRCAKGSKVPPRLHFMLSLHEQLSREFLIVRMCNQRIGREVRVALDKILGPVGPVRANNALAGGNEEYQQEGDRKYCSYCPYQKRRYTKTYCANCGKAICGEHQKKICKIC